MEAINMPQVWKYNAIAKHKDKKQKTKQWIWMSFESPPVYKSAFAAMATCIFRFVWLCLACGLQTAEDWLKNWLDVQMVDIMWKSIKPAWRMKCRHPHLLTQFLHKPQMLLSLYLCFMYFTCLYINFSYNNL